MDQSEPSDVVTLPLRALIRLYQWLRIGAAPRCRFYPSCSEFAREALAQKGLWTGLALSGRRLLRCHPWNPGGYDPVPQTSGK